MKRKICCFSGKRGGFGAYLVLMQLIQTDPELELQILLGDMHASREFGETRKEVKNYFPLETIRIINMGAGRGDTPLIRVENLGLCLREAGRVLSEINPGVVLVHGDRGEHLMVAFAALNLGIPIAHTQGGEVSGNIDDTQRQAISKMAHIHFPETREAEQRLIKMGEEARRIFCVGSVYIDRIVKKMYSGKEVRKKYELNNDDFSIVIVHPDTFLSHDDNYKMTVSVLEGVRQLGKRAIIVNPCSDPGYGGVLNAIQEFSLFYPSVFFWHKNIDNLDFLGLMAEASFIIGNSSCALVEAPYFQLPAVDVGNRQRGRDREKNIIGVPAEKEAIKFGIKFVLEDKSFRSELKKCGHRLGDGTASRQILEILKMIPLKDLLAKQFNY